MIEIQWRFMMTDLWRRLNELVDKSNAHTRKNQMKKSILSKTRSLESKTQFT